VFLASVLPEATIDVTLALTEVSTRFAGVFEIVGLDVPPIDSNRR
jgi:hypothetical protein